MLQHKSSTCLYRKIWGFWLLEENYCSSTIDLNVCNPWSNSPITPLGIPWFWPWKFVETSHGKLLQSSSHKVRDGPAVWSSLQRFGHWDNGIFQYKRPINGWRFRPKKTRLLKGPAISPQVKSIMGQPTYVLAPPKLKIMEIIDTVQSKMIRKKTTGIVVESRFQQNPIYK